MTVMDRYEWGVICTNCLCQYRHDEYNANECNPFICSNCGETEHFREWLVPKKKKRVSFWKWLLQRKERANWGVPLMVRDGLFQDFREVIAIDPYQLW